MKQKKQSPWAVRRAKAAAGGTGLAVQKFLQEPVPSAMLGAALLSGQPCLLWNSQTMLNQVLKNDERRLQASCWMLLEQLLKKIASKSEKEAEEGYTILFRLLIEPFALMNQSTAFYPVGCASHSTTRE